MTVVNFEPPFPARKAPAFVGSGRDELRVVIVGAGLAGCSAAYALAAQGFECVLLDRHRAGPGCFWQPRRTLPRHRQCRRWHARALQSLGCTAYRAAPASLARAPLDCGWLRRTASRGQVHARDHASTDR